jgi:D-sedoheptulose 7-phosphate isomerase
MGVIKNYFEEIKTTIDQIPAERIEEVIAILMEARINRNQIFVMGNGGSASTASHFVCDLAKNTRTSRLPGFRVIGLTDNMAIFSAYANDEGYETVFAQQLNNLLQPNDVVIAISASGNSKNVLEGIETAKQLGAKTIGFTGMSGGKLFDMAGTVLHVPSFKIDQVEDIHLMLEHIICRTLKEMEQPVERQQVEILQPRDKKQYGDPETLVQELFGKFLPMVQQSGDMTISQDKRAEILDKICQEFSEKLDLHQLLTQVLCLTLEYIGAVGGSIVVLDEHGEVVDGALAYAGEVYKREINQLNDTINQGLAGWVLEHRQAALVSNTKNDPRWLPRGWENSLDLSRSAICVPIMNDERISGVLTLTRLQSNRFTLEDLSLLTSITLALSCSINQAAVTNR